jgi:sensor domain DACNV-containing protein
VHPRFARQLEIARTDGQLGLPLSPLTEDIETMIDAAFWASLRREEGYAPTISAAFLSPDGARNPLRFEQPVPFIPDALTRLAPAVERPGIHLGVWRRNDGLQVWGTTSTIPKYCFVIEVTSPGLLVVKESRGEDSGKFANIAVLEGDQIKILSEDAANLPDCPPLVRSLLAFDAVTSPTEDVNVLVQLAVSMRAHGRGGSLLVVPAKSEAWRESIIPPTRYSVFPPFMGLAELLDQGPVSRNRRWQDALRRTVDAIAGLTAVDGATVITDAHELLAFGAKIGRRRHAARVEQVVVTEPVKDAVAEIMPPAQLGGTRHLSAAQFGQDQPDSIALVASQDGRFTVFAWSPCEQMVHAHRIETLLL